MSETVLGGAIGFLSQLGIYEVVLPFLLVFTLMFAFLEKTKVLGIETLKSKDGKEYNFSRKNLNSLVAFTIAFFVIASSQLVRIISGMLGKVVLLVVLGLSYMLATGVFHTGTGEYKVNEWEKTTFSIISLIGVLSIFLHELGWLELIYNFILSAWDSANIAAIIMILCFIGFMAWISYTPDINKVDKGKDDKKKEG
jgi:hypothetical protein